MTLKPFACLLTAAVVALAATPAPAQNVFDPTTWFAPQRPICPPAYGYRASAPRPVYPNYAGPVGSGNFYRGNYGSNCPDGICGPSNYDYRRLDCPNGQCFPNMPRYNAPVTPMPYNGGLAPAPAPGPIGWSNSPRLPYNDRRITPVNYDDDWSVTPTPRMRTPYGSNNSPYYP